MLTLPEAIRAWLVIAIERVSRSGPVVAALPDAMPGRGAAASGGGRTD